MVKAHWRAVIVSGLTLMLLGGVVTAWACPDVVGQCVYPKTKEKRGRLVLLHPIMLLSAPREDAPNPKPLKSLVAFSVAAQKGPFIQIITTPDYDAPDPQQGAGKVAGWVRLADFDMQELRNCH